MGVGGVPGDEVRFVGDRLTADGQLRALLTALAEGSGVEALWEMLSERARAPLVDREGVARALAHGLWAPLVGHERAEVFDVDERGDVARARVRVEGPRGGAVYLVSLRRSGVGWRVTGLVRDDLPWG